MDNSIFNTLRIQCKNSKVFSLKNKTTGVVNIEIEKITNNIILYNINYKFKNHKVNNSVNKFWHLKRQYINFIKDNTYFFCDIYDTHKYVANVFTDNPKDFNVIVNKYYKFLKLEFKENNKYECFDILKNYILKMEE
jgi:hypothetical protein